MTPKTLTPTRQAQLDFWTGFHSFATANANQIKPTAAQPETWMDMAIGRSDFRLAAFAPTWNWDNASEPEVRAALWVDGKNAGRHFALLETEKDAIHVEFGEALDWIEKPGVNLRTIHLRRSVNWRDPRTRQDCYQWLVNKLDKLHKVFQPRIRCLPKA